jgi:hypothetical protein
MIQGRSPLRSRIVLIQTLQRGRVYSSADDNPNRLLANICNTIQTPSKCFVFARRSPRRIRESGIQPDEIRWMTEREHPNSIQPSLEHLFGEINKILQSGTGIIWIEGLGVLIHMQGFDSTLKFVRRIVDAIRQTNYLVILMIDPLTISETELVRIRRECPNINNIDDFVSITDNEPTTEVKIKEKKKLAVPATANNPNLSESEQEIPSIKIPNPKISRKSHPLDIVLPPLLSRIPASALDDSIIERRTEQWQLQGFDVTRMDLALKLEGEERSRVYFDIEESIRRAIDCLRRILRLERPRFSGTIAKLSFRAFQLTALTELEKELDLLEVAGHL